MPRPSPARAHSQPPSSRARRTTCHPSPAPRGRVRAPGRQSSTSRHRNTRGASQWVGAMRSGGKRPRAPGQRDLQQLQCSHRHRAVEKILCYPFLSFLIRSIINMFSSSTLVATVLALFAGTSLGAWGFPPFESEVAGTSVLTRSAGCNMLDNPSYTYVLRGGVPSSLCVPW